MMLSRSVHSFKKIANPLGWLNPVNPNVLMPLVVQSSVQQQQVRTTIRKHYDPKFRRLRGAKFIKVDLPDLNEDKNTDLTPEIMRTKLKEKGIQPFRTWNERSLYVSNSGTVFEPYVPPEGDGKLSMVTVEGAKQKFEIIEKKGKSMLAVRKIKSYDEDFTLQDFVEDALEVYKKSHEALVNFRNNKEKLEEFVTEKAYVEMTENVKYKTLVWKFHKSLGPPKVVHARAGNVVTKENIFAQVTVRFHTQQSLCIYDRFGRKEYGDENIIKDVLEYVVFEKHISEQYGAWRMHHKIIPDWMPAAEPVPRTFRKPDPLPDLPEESEIKTAEDQNEESKNMVPALA
ncbi:large ribosomal subunit protein mL45 [Neocloeon triangulifer]|uniref:large ribosomal subunit protein mL45 n=1 Tax=Neocloeon triangulifer TaxID=2078957 RepID=UPI00286ED85C|nr:large ribosomal subunit protein mL45 [Neocloeon triangulifer]